MLQFIVLGQIPGTSVQINFYSFMIGVASAGIILLAMFYVHDRRRRAARQLANVLAVL